MVLQHGREVEPEAAGGVDQEDGQGEAESLGEKGEEEAEVMGQQEGVEEQER